MNTKHVVVNRDFAKDESSILSTSKTRGPGISRFSYSINYAMTPEEIVNLSLSNLIFTYNLHFATFKDQTIFKDNSA